MLFEFIFKQYIQKIKASKKSDRKRILIRSTRRFNKLPEGTLADNQKALIRDMLRLACLCEVSHEPSIYNNPDGYNDRVGFYLSFGFPWSDMDDTAEPYFNSIDEEWGNSYPPSITLVLNKKKDFIGATLVLRRLMLMQRICYWQPILSD